MEALEYFLGKHRWSLCREFGERPRRGPSGRARQTSTPPPRAPRAAPAAPPGVRLWKKSARRMAVLVPRTLSRGHGAAFVETDGVGAPALGYYVLRTNAPKGY